LVPLSAADHGDSPPARRGARLEALGGFGRGRGGEGMNVPRVLRGALLAAALLWALAPEAGRYRAERLLRVGSEALRQLVTHPGEVADPQAGGGPRVDSRDRAPGAEVARRAAQGAPATAGMRWLLRSGLRTRAVRLLPEDPRRPDAPDVKLVEEHRLEDRQTVPDRRAERDLRGLVEVPGLDRDLPDRQSPGDSLRDDLGVEHET